LTCDLVEDEDTNFGWSFSAAGEDSCDCKFHFAVDRRNADMDRRVTAHAKILGTTSSRMGVARIRRSCCFVLIVLLAIWCKGKKGAPVCCFGHFLFLKSKPRESINFKNSVYVTIGTSTPAAQPPLNACAQICALNPLNSTQRLLYIRNMYCNSTKVPIPVCSVPVYVGCTSTYYGTTVVAPTVS